jgi:hypothetical protein
MRKTTVRPSPLMRSALISPPVTSSRPPPPLVSAIRNCTPSLETTREPSPLMSIIEPQKQSVW